VTYYLLHTGQPSAKRLLKRVADLREYKSAADVRAEDVVIRFGESYEADPPQGRVLNPRNAMERAKGRQSMITFLRRMGVRTLPKNPSSQGINIARHYRFPIYDLRGLTCFRSDTGPAWVNQRIQRIQENFREVALDDDKVTMRAMYLAVRALHTLGLDNGLVSIAMGQKGVLYVVDVTPNPVLKGRLLDVFVSAVERHMDVDAELAKNGVGPFLLGTDVEVMLKNATSGKMVLASQFFSRKGKIGCDDRSVQFDGKRLPLLELRPDPDSNPLALINNLKKLMTEAATAINRRAVEWRAGSMPFKPYSIGGHIHFSGVPFSSQLVRALDNYVGLPLMVIEDQKTAVPRRVRYGFYGDIRHKDYGGFEYRTPGSFVVSPEIAAAAICLAYVVAVHHRELPVYDIYDRNLQESFFKGHTGALAPIAERNLSLLSRTSTYARYREQIDPLLAMIRSGTVWDEMRDVRVAWGVPLVRPKATQTPMRRRAASRG
jgi:hypothetical protein